MAIPKETDKDKEPGLKHLFPDLNDEELQAVEETFCGYLDICTDIFDDIQKDPDRKAAFEARIKRGAKAVLDKGS